MRLIETWILICTLLSFPTLWAQKMKTFTFAEKEGQVLSLDFYFPEKNDEKTICIVYVFGGGFKEGGRNSTSVSDYCNLLCKNGFQVAAIDYRLGMKTAKSVGITNYSTLQNAIHMATEDCISALEFLLRNKEPLKINTDKIILVGSSAGAITALQTNYALCNGLLNTETLPADFRLAGVVSYAGAIFSTDGKVSYRNHPPAPTLFFHGTSDNLLVYNQIKLFKIGFFGANSLTKRFKKFGYPFAIRRYVDYGHSVAMLYSQTLSELKWFCEHFILKGEKLQIEEAYNNLDKSELPAFDKMDASDLYK